MSEAKRAMGRSGFTLIELLIVVVIIGLLASIAIPKFGATKARAYVARMQSDLRNLATAQEAYSYSNTAYYNGPIPNAAALAFDPSPGVTVVLSNVTPSGWAARATHAQLPGRACALFYGSAAPVAPATTEGQVACN